MSERGVDDQNIVITGFMGTGKTTAGRMLAELLDREFVDTDDVIEQRHGSIAQIFEIEGEDAFREMERALAAELAGQAGLVIATGGGMLLDPANTAALTSTGRVFCLVASPEEIFERVAGDALRIDRPLLSVTDPQQRIGELLAERDAGYQTFEQVSTSGQRSNEVAQVLLELVTSSTGTLEVESVDGVAITLHQLGGSGPPVLICHATGFHGMAYAPMASHLVESHAVWAVDFRGHGASPAPESGDFSWWNMAADVEACIEAIGRTPVHAIGHSMGGAAIVMSALRHPHLFASAYLFEPIILPSGAATAGSSFLSEGARRRRPTFPSKTAAVEHYGGRPPLNQLHPDALAAYVEFGFDATASGEATLRCRPEDEALTFEADDKITVDELHDLQLRLMVAAGRTEDGPSPADFPPIIASAVDGAVLVSHDEIGHFGPLEDPRAIAREALAWFAGDPTKETTS